MATTNQTNLTSQNETTNVVTSPPRRFSSRVADWTRSIVVVAGCFVIVACTATVVYVACQGLLFIIGLVRRALAPENYP